MDNENQPIDSGMTPDNAPDTLRISPTIRSSWQESTKWSLFFAVLGFIYVGLLIIGVLAGSRNPLFGAGVFMLVIMGTLIFIPTWFIFQFSQKLKKGLETEDTALAEEGFANLRRLYQYAGIVTIIILAFYVLFFLVFLTMMPRTM